jgi:hypothetical protein
VRVFSRDRWLRLGLLFLVLSLFSSARAASVWKVTGPNGGVLYLGGSIHGLNSTDYPLPSAYNRAFDASSALVIEDDPNVSKREMEKFMKSGFYPRGDSLKNHLDPRTYDYLRRIFALAHIPEAELLRCKPWMVVEQLIAPTTNNLGVEAFLMGRARMNHKPILGLETFREHQDVIAGLPDKEAELVLLENFVPQTPGTDLQKKILSAWRKGDVDEIARLDQGLQRDLPDFAARLITDRSRNWIPKIERYIRDRHTYFVVAGAGHMGGRNGVVAMLRARGYKVEPL